MHEQEHITDRKKRFIADNFKNTELGLARIAKNLGLQDISDSDIVRHCHKIILSTPIQAVENHGKNYYFYSREFSAVLTINKSSLGIITAKQLG